MKTQPLLLAPSRGAITASRLLSVRDLGIGNPEPHIDLAIKAFLAVGQGVAPRLILMPKAVLLLQMVPGDSASGALYLYDRRRQEFYMLSFDGPNVRDDNLTIDDFSRLVPEYNLLHYAERPDLLEALCCMAGTHVVPSA